MADDGEWGEPVIINASDIAKLKRTAFHGSHGKVDDDPDLFQPASIGVTRNFPAMTVRADPDGCTLNTARLRTEMTLNEVDDLILALQEAREYLEIHQK